MIALARTIAATRTQSRIARELYDRNLPDLMMVYLEGTDVVGHVFASYVAPKMDCVSAEDFRRYGRAVDEYYALVDRLIGQWMRRAEEDGATLIVNSDHGFKWGADRSCERGSLNPATAGFWHRIEGVFAAWGARVGSSSERGGASVFDVEPTVAALLGLPVDRQAEGSPIRAAFHDLAAPPRKDLGTAIPVRRLAAEQMSEKEASEYAKKLMALGYLSGGEPGKLAPSGGDRPGMTEGAWNNLGLYLSRNGKPNAARAEEAYRRRSPCGRITPRPSSTSPCSTGNAATRARPWSGSSARLPRGTPIPRERSSSGPPTTRRRASRAPSARCSSAARASTPTASRSPGNSRSRASAPKTAPGAMRRWRGSRPRPGTRTP